MNRLPRAKAIQRDGLTFSPICKASELLSWYRHNTSRATSSHVVNIYFISPFMRATWFCHDLGRIGECLSWYNMITLSIINRIKNDCRAISIQTFLYRQRLFKIWFNFIFNLVVLTWLFSKFISASKRLNFLSICQ